MQVATYHIGETNIMNCGEEATIIDWKSIKNITVEFKKYNETIKNNYSNFKKGNIKSNYSLNVYDVGYLGNCEYRAYDDKNKVTPQYRYWKDMLRRCYSEKALIKNPTYIGCSVCDEWHNFQVFSKWYDENYYQVGSQEMHLDKDILHKGNKTYSPDTCCFVPQSINKLFVKSEGTRGDYPIGVSIDKYNKFVSRCSIFKNNEVKQIYLGRFNNPNDAFYTYKQFKENHIKGIAEDYKNQIPTNIYEAMYKYKVEIID